MRPPLSISYHRNSTISIKCMVVVEFSRGSKLGLVTCMSSFVSLALHVVWPLPVILSDTLIYRFLLFLLVSSGSVSILPTLLFLTTGVIRELAPADAEVVPGAVGTALQTLKALATSPCSRNGPPEVTEQWINLLQSTLASIIEFSKTPGKLELCVLKSFFPPPT